MLRSKLMGGLGIGLLALVVASCGGSSSSSGGGGGSASVSCTAGATTVCVDVNPNNTATGLFNPNSLSVKSGDSVTWTFTDQSNQHTVTFDDGSFDSGTQSGGYTTKQTIGKPAGTTVSYHCTLHADMTGKIIVQ